MYIINFKFSYPKNIFGNGKRECTFFDNRTFISTNCLKQNKCQPLYLSLRATNLLKSSNVEWGNEMHLSLRVFSGFGDEMPQESFDDWADRLTSEYRAKRKGGRLPEQETESREQKKRKTEDENSRNAKHKKKQKRGPDRRNHTLLMRLRYEKRMAAFEAEDGEDVGFDDIPWPGSTDNTDHMVTILVSDKSKMSAEDLKKYLRTHQRTWHPDKFMQKFGKRLKESDRERILDKVKELSQALNKAGEEGEKKDEWDY